MRLTLRRSVGPCAVSTADMKSSKCLARRRSRAAAALSSLVCGGGGGFSSPLPSFQLLRSAKRCPGLNPFGGIIWDNGEEGIEIHGWVLPKTRHLPVNRRAPGCGVQRWIGLRNAPAGSKQAWSNQCRTAGLAQHTAPQAESPVKVTGSMEPTESTTYAGLRKHRHGGGGFPIIEIQRMKLMDWEQRVRVDFPVGGEGRSSLASPGIEITPDNNPK